jgi:hypothetical protein
MSEELARYESERRPLTAAQIKAQVQLIQEVMSAVMKEGHHYGKIPGTTKPTLYKPGAEKLLSTFRIGADPKDSIEDLSVTDEIRYRVAVKGFSQETGNLLGVGIGECSSSEEKYKWRKPVCDEEFDETPTERKRMVWKRGESKPYQQKQVRTNPTDVANTVLKMAKKRALVDMTLTITAASDIFDQDLEDIPEGMDVGTSGKPPIKEPQKKQNGTAASDVKRVITPILNVIKKDGVNKATKKPWVKYSIFGHLEGNETSFNTFSQTFADAAAKEKGTGATFEITYEKNQYGCDIKDMKAAEPGPQENAQ